MDNSNRFKYQRLLSLSLFQLIESEHNHSEDWESSEGRTEGAESCVRSRWGKRGSGERVTWSRGQQEGEEGHQELGDMAREEEKLRQDKQKMRGADAEEANACTSGIISIRAAGEPLPEEMVDISEYLDTNENEAVVHKNETVIRTKKSKKDLKKDKDNEKSSDSKTKMENESAVNNRKFSQKIQKLGFRFYCRNCSFEASNKQQARFHSFGKCGEAKKTVKKRKKQKIVKCLAGNCSAEFASNRERAEHHRKLHEKARECSKCGKVLKNYKIWSRHIRLVCGPEEKRFKCIKCCFKTDRNSEFIKHLEKKHGPPLHISQVVAGAPGVNLPGPSTIGCRRMVKLWESTVLLMLSKRIIHIMRLVESKPNRLKLLSKISINFDIEDIVVPQLFPTVVSVIGRSRVTTLYLTTDGLPSAQLDLPSHLLLEPFVLVWPPGQLDYVAIQTKDCETIVEVKAEQEVRAVSKLRVEGETLSGVTFRREGVETIYAIVLTTSGKIYYNKMDINISELVLINQLQVSIPLCCYVFNPS